MQVTDINEAPIISGDLAFAVELGWEYQLTVSDLSAADARIGGGNTEIIWRVTDTNSGYFVLSSDASAPIRSFTQSQLEAGSVIYKNAYGGGATDSFSVRAKYDGSAPQATGVVTVAVEVVLDTYPENKRPHAATSVTNPWLSALIYQDGRWSTNPDDASLVTFTYQFQSGYETHDFGKDQISDVGKVWYQYEKNALYAAMEMWEAVANIDFIEVDASQYPELEYWLLPDLPNNWIGAHFYPHVLPGGVVGGYFDYEQRGWNSDGLNIGGQPFVVILHELGHGLGLSHPHDEGTFPGVSDDDDDDLGDYDLNQGIYTVMSYNRGWDEEDVPGSPNYGRAGTPMAFDIAAIQELYGANMAFRVGDDIYTLPDTNGIGTYWSCIWDAGGDDTISAAGASLDCKIDLRAAALEGKGGGGYVSYMDDIIGGFTIANTVSIENAIGGDGDDEIIGNAAANTLTGGGGDDTLTGGSGSDVFIFGSVSTAGFTTTISDNFGEDTITDFEVIRDTIQFRSAGEAATREEFIAALQSDDGDVVYDFGNDGINVLRLSGVTLAELETTLRVVGDEFRVNSETEKWQERPSVASLSDGGFVVAWQSQEQDGDGYGIYAQRYDYVGNTVGDEFSVNSETEKNQEEPAVTGLSDGGFVVAWQSQGQDGSGYGIYAQRYDSAGNTVGNEFRVNSETRKKQEKPAVAALSDGGFVVVWESLGQDGDDYGIYAQRYDNVGDTVGNEFRVNSETVYAQWGSSVAALGDGGFIVTWGSFKDGIGAGVYAQRYDSAGNAVGDEFRAYPSGKQSEPSVAALSGGGYVVVWQSVRSKNDEEICVFAQRYDSAGNIVGDRIQVNDYEQGNRMYPSVTAVKDDGFVVAWESYKQDGKGDGIYAQIYDGSEFRVNSETEKGQERASVAGLNGGGFVVVWQSRWQDGSEEGIYAQRYDSVGNAVGGEFRVNSETAQEQEKPSVAALRDGGFVVVWESQGQDGNGYGVYAQHYDSAGDAVGDEFRVNSHTAGRQWWPSVAALEDGGFVVVWTSNKQDGSGHGVYAQRYDSAGHAVGSEFRVNHYTTGDQDAPAVAALGDGGFIVVWESWGQDGGGNGVYAQRYDNAGNTLGNEFQVNSLTANWQHKPSVAALDDGGFVLVWQSSKQDGSGNGIYAQRYDSASNTVGSEFRINSYTADHQRDISVTALSDGGFVVAWESEGQDGSGYGVYAQRYDSAGNAVGHEFRANNYATGDQDGPSVAALNNGDFVLAWESQGQDGVGDGVFAKIYAADETPDDWFVNVAFASDDTLLFG